MRLRLLPVTTAGAVWFRRSLNRYMDMARIRRRFQGSRGCHVCMNRKQDERQRCKILLSSYTATSTRGCTRSSRWPVQPRYGHQREIAPKVWSEAHANPYYPHRLAYRLHLSILHLPIIDAVRAILLWCRGTRQLTVRSASSCFADTGGSHPIRVYLSHVHNYSAGYSIALY